MIYNKSMFGNIDFSPYGASVIKKKGLETRFSHVGKMGKH